MGRRKRTEVTIETRRLIAVRSRRSCVHAYCPLCGFQVNVITVDEAALLAGVCSRAIWLWVEEGRLHVQETAEGLLRICLRSLLDLKR